MAQVKSENPDTRLQQRLTKFPQADANGDGILTQSEAEAFQKARKQAKTSKKNSPGGEPASPTHADVSYGSHERNKLDFWRAKSDHPRPRIGISTRPASPSAAVQPVRRWHCGSRCTTIWPICPTTILLRVFRLALHVPARTAVPPDLSLSTLRSKLASLSRARRCGSCLAPLHKPNSSRRQKSLWREKHRLCSTPRGTIRPYS